MKIIDKKTGIDIISCNDIETLRNIILNNIENSLNMCEEYSFFVLNCYRNNLPLVSVRDWLKVRNK